MSKFALIIEDDIDLSTIFAEALKNATYDTEVIHDGNTALKRLATTTPDVVVLDLHLPGVDGTNILREIRADKRLSETRVLVAILVRPFARASRYFPKTIKVMMTAAVSKKRCPSISLSKTGKE